MADISALLANSAVTNADFDIGKLNKSYWEGEDQSARIGLREAFKNGVPTLPDGSVDYGAMQRTLYQKGGLEQGNALSGISARAAELDALRGSDGPPAAPMVGPSTSRNSVAPDPGSRTASPAAPARPQPQAQPTAQPAQQPTVMTVLAAQGIPNSELGKAADSVARQLGVDPTAPLNLQDPQVRNVLAPAIAQIKRMGLGQVQPPQPGDNAPQAAPGGAPSVAQPVQVAAQNDPVLKRLTILAASQDKQIAAAAKVRLESYLKNQELTPDQKNAAASGQSLPDYQNRSDENAAQLAILKDSILPKLDLSHKAAEAARDEITAIHRSREQLDAQGGIFSGSASEIRLKIAKAAELLGVPNADKIANTEAFGAAIGSRVLSLVKGLGAGTSISNSDRAFAEKMAGGNINLDEASIRKILDIGERAARSKIDMHNTNAGKIIKSNEALKGYSDVYNVEAPGQYAPPSKGKAGTPPSVAGAKQAPDGNFYVPDPARPGKYLKVVQ